MPNESKTPDEYISDALDLMVTAGWVKQHARSVKTGIAVDWMEHGKTAIEALWLTILEVGAENLNQRLWWALGTTANMRFNPPPA